MGKVAGRSSRKHRQNGVGQSRFDQRPSRTNFLFCAAACRGPPHESAWTNAARHV